MKFQNPNQAAKLRPLSPTRCVIVCGSEQSKLIFIETIYLELAPAPFFLRKTSDFIYILSVLPLHMLSPFVAFYCNSTLLLERAVENQMLAKLKCVCLFIETLVDKS